MFIHTQPLNSTIFGENMRHNPCWPSGNINDFRSNYQRGLSAFFGIHISGIRTVIPGCNAAVHWTLLAPFPITTTRFPLTLILVGQFAV